jgi:elongation factor Ts
MIGKIVDGQLAKWAKEVALLDQEHVNTEKHESKSIEELRQELASKTGENVRVARFAYFRVGEE